MKVWHLLEKNRMFYIKYSGLSIKMKSYNRLWDNSKFELWGINVVGIILEVFGRKEL